MLTATETAPVAVPRMSHVDTEHQQSPRRPVTSQKPEGPSGANTPLVLLGRLTYSPMYPDQRVPNMIKHQFGPEATTSSINGP
jgi:hypothetical protein